MNNDTVPESGAGLLNNTLENIRQRRLEERGGKELDAYVQQFEEAAIYEEAVIQLFETDQYIGQAILEALWHIHYNDLVTRMGEFNTLLEWATDRLSEYKSPQYIINLVNIVERTFTEVHARYVKGNPFVTSEGEVITVELLIQKRGLIGKLQLTSNAFITATEEDKEKLLNAVVTKPRSDVEAVRDAVQGKRIIKLPYREIPADEKHTTIAFPDLDRDQRDFLIALIGDSGEILMA